MRRLLVATLVATATWIGVPAANAVCAHTHPDGSFWVHSGACESFGPPPEQQAEMHGGHENDGGRRSGPGYLGGCAVDAVNDTTPGGGLGGQNIWNGQVNVAIAATIPGATVTASCWIRVNGGAEAKVLDATAAGPVAFGAGRVTFNADTTDVVAICTHVTTGQTGFSEVCADLTVTPVCPDTVCGDGGLLDQPLTLNPANCGVLATLAPVVDSLPAGVVYIDPATGDTYVGGGPIVLHWDCPPFE